jgi:uncharacterized repeat protein (TIGR02543 family)
LAISKNGTGTGSVSSNPAGISCGATCSASFAKGQSVVLTATADSGNAFTSWSGCDSTNANQCTVAANGAKSVTARFEPTYTVTYSGNNSTGGSAPTDGSSPYLSGSTVTVLGNTGTLVKTGYTFAGWNTAADGSGTNYAVAAAFAISGSITLYAKWIATVTYNGNGNNGGSVPTDAGNYLSGATVTVLGNTGTLVKIGYTFAG